MYFYNLSFDLPHNSMVSVLLNVTPIVLTYNCRSLGTILADEDIYENLSVSVRN